MRQSIKLLSGLLSLSLLAGCQTPGENLKSNVYQAGQVNQQQDASVVDILAVLPAKVEVSNAQNQATAQTAGLMLGLIGGAALGGGLSHHFGGAALGGAAGGFAGNAAGSLVPGTALVEGVSLTYTDNSGKTHNSAQVGRACEFKPGRAILITTDASSKETRIQPNDTCPAPTH